MADQPNNEEHEPIRFTDKRRIDPETGEIRDPSVKDPAQQSAQEASAADATEYGDPLSQVEDILNSASAAGADGADAAAGNGDAAAATEASAADASDQDVPVVDEAEELRADLQRLNAEFVNYRRRVDRDRDVAKDNAQYSMLVALLPVLDDLDAAEAAGDLDGPFAAIGRKLVHTLEGLGLVKHDGSVLVGQPFDPVHHEAMLRQPSEEIPEEHIVQVFRNGYLHNDRVLRAAQVMVSAGQA